MKAVTEASKPSLSTRIVIQMAIASTIPFLPVLISGRWDWWEAWAYGIVCTAGFVASRLLVARRHPDLLEERVAGLRRDDIEVWDRTIVRLIGLGGVLIPLAAGLEAIIAPRPGLGLEIKVVALALVISGYAFGSWALVENRYFSTVVRIQSDRGHQVVSSGPYRWIRHPGHSGAILACLATPFLLDSTWVLAPVGLITIVMVMRTSLEDRLLQQRLDGYAAYASRVRHRLLPGIW